MPREVYQCQVNGRLSIQACGAKADQVYRCEVIGSHDNHQVGEHTIRHSLLGNGYTCSSIQELDKNYDTKTT